MLPQETFSCLKLATFLSERKIEPFFVKYVMDVMLRDFKSIDFIFLVLRKRCFGIASDNKVVFKKINDPRTSDLSS